MVCLFWFRLLRSFVTLLCVVVLFSLLFRCSVHCPAYNRTTVTMPKRKNWSDEEWVFLLEMAERPEVSQILALIGPSRRGPPPKDDRHLAEATHYVVDKWQDTFDQPWVEESQAEFVERKRQLQQTLPERWKKGMEYVRHTAESKGAFEQRRGKLNDVSVITFEDRGSTLTWFSAGVCISFAQAHRTSRGLSSRIEHTIHSRAPDPNTQGVDGPRSAQRTSASATKDGYGRIHETSRCFFVASATQDR